MKALFELFRRFDARRIFGFIRRLGGMSRPRVKRYDLLSTRALRVEGDLLLLECGMPITRFLSTPSGWRATTFRAAQGPHTPISIHALRVEGDRGSQGRRGLRAEFLSTPSGWRATLKRLYCFGVLKAYFYPRPPGGGRPAVEITPRWRALYFYPRPPGGGRRWGWFDSDIELIFLSTPSGWRATWISRIFQACTRYFYPRPPGGGRRDGPVGGGAQANDFYPRPPGGGRPRSKFAMSYPKNFYPRPPGGGRHHQRRRKPTRRNFYPRPPGGGRLHRT